MRCSSGPSCWEELRNGWKIRFIRWPAESWILQDVDQLLPADFLLVFPGSNLFCPGSECLNMESRELPSRRALAALLRHIFNGQQNKRMPRLQFHPAGIQQHVSRSEMRKFMAHLESVHPRISWNNFLQQFAQLRNIPLPVTQRINQMPFCFFRRHLESPVESRVRDGNFQFGVQYQERFPGALDNRIRIFASLVQSAFEHVDILQADHRALDAIIPGLIGTHVQHLPSAFVSTHLALLG